MESISSDALLNMMTEMRRAMDAQQRELTDLRAQLAEVRGAQHVAAGATRVVERALSSHVPAPSRRRLLVTGLAVSAGGAAALGAGAALAGIVGRSPRVADAAVPATVNYQGRLTDSTGAPLTGTYNMSFSLYAQATGGTAVWGPETHTGASAVQVNSGLFSVFLGAITPIPASILSQSLWLGVTVGADPEMTPREQLGSTTTALNAAALAGYPASTSATANAIPVLGASGTMPANTVATASIIDSSVINWAYQVLAPPTVPSSANTTTSYVAVPGVSVTLTTSGKPVLLKALYPCADSNNPQNGSVTISGHDFTVDGTRPTTSLTTLQIPHMSPYYTTVSMWAIVQPAAGTHTISIVTLGFNSNMHVTMGTSEETGYLAALELKK